MIDLLSLGVTHALMLLALWRLLGRADLDDESARAPAAWGGNPDTPRDA